MKDKPTEFISSISGEKLINGEFFKGDQVRHTLMAIIQKDHPDFNDDSYISMTELNVYRKKYLETLINKESGDLDAMEKEVVEAISKNEVMSENVENNLKDSLTIGQKAADKIAKFGGSWTFIIYFFFFIMVWISINIWALMMKPFDPYPFILLNLILSCLAAIQAPIIMMSQNRKEDKDRQRSEYDYKVNLKAELEIRMLNEKIDHMMLQQNQRLLEIQELQADYLEDILRQLKKED